MDEVIVLELLALLFGICTFLAWFFTHKARHQERMLMIEKGMNPYEGSNKEGRLKLFVTKLGILIVGLSIGLAVIAVLVEFDSLGRSNAIPLSILGICGGAALVVANRLSAGR